MHFLITFGFRINLVQQGDTAVTKNEVRTERKQKVNARKEADEVNNKNLVNAEQQNNIINATCLLTELHIEYDPVPFYHFSCNCKIWDGVTEVCHNGRTRYLKNLLISNSDETALWIVFSIHHMTELNESQLKTFFNHKIVIRITSGRETSAKSKNGKAKQFRIRGEYEATEEDPFLEIYPINSNEPEKKSIPASPIIVKDNHNSSFAIVSYVDPLPDIVHGQIFRNMLKTENVPSQIIDIEQEDPILESKPSKTKAKKTASKEDKTKQRLKTDYRMVVEADILFGKMGTLTRYDSSPEIRGISNLLVYIQCDDILSNDASRAKFGPISINLEKLQNFPRDILIECGFLYAYMRTTFVDQVIQTPHYKIDESIYFEHVKTFLSEDFRPEQLISFLATNALMVEVIGIRATSGRDLLPPDRHGLNKSDSKAPVLLGVAIFDLSELLRGSSEVKSANSLHHPSVVYSANMNDSTSAVSDEKSPISWSESPLIYETLVLSDTSIQLQVRLGVDLRPIHRRVLRGPDILNRMLLILRDLGFARQLLEDVSLHNVTILQAAECLNSNNQTRLKPECEDYITGFVIDCTDRWYILLEGLSNGYLPRVWESISNLPIRAGCVYYNSDCLFLTRLYDKFISANGILKVQLSGTLEEQLGKHRVYIGKSAKTGQSEIVRKLGLIKLTYTMRSVCQSGLLPDPEQLISLKKNEVQNEDILISRWMS